MILLDISVKKKFKSEKPILRNLYRMAAYAKTTAQRSMRVRGKKRGRRSLPGEPPRVKSTSSPLRQLWGFVVDEKNLTIDVGPIIFRRSNIPRLLEFGGEAFQAASKKTYFLAPRPYLRPALTKTIKRFSI